jgi:hypothetical protein
MSNEPENDDDLRKLTPQEVEELVSRMPKSEPRPHHYILAHIALRSLALENPLRFLALMGSPDADKFLDSVFQALNDSLKEDGPGDFTMRDVRYERGKLGEWLCIVFVMPPPKAVTEAYYCCLAGYLDPKEPNPAPESVRGRWFTLEYGLAEDGGARTVFCEWTKDGTHENYGDGPEPTLEKFLEVVAAKVVPTTPGFGLSNGSPATN